MQNMFFEGRALKPYGDYVRATDLVVGRVYFKVGFLDQDMVVPELSAWVFIGSDLHRELPGLYFQDADSYLSGARRGDDEFVPTFEAEQLPDGCRWGEDIQFEWQKPRQYSDVYEFEGALDLLLACSLRRKQWDGQVWVREPPPDSE